MMDMKYLDATKEMLSTELESIVKKGGITRQDLDTIQKITSSLKNVGKIKECEEGEMYSMRMSREPYSREPYSRYSMADDYSGTNSYRRSYADGIGHTQFVNDRYSRADEREMISERIQHMIDENRMSGDEKTALKKALEMLR